MWLLFNGNRIKYFDEGQKLILDKFKNQEIILTVQRGTETKEIPVKVDSNGKLGVSSGQLPFKDLEKLGYYNLAEIEYSFVEAIPAGWNKSMETLTDYVKAIKKDF